MIGATIGAVVDVPNNGAGGDEESTDAGPTLHTKKSSVLILRPGQ